MIGSKLRTTLKRISENLIVDEEQLHLQQQSQGMTSQEEGFTSVVSSPVEDKRDKVAHPHISLAVDLSHPNGLYGLASRIVATQSL